MGTDIHGAFERLIDGKWTFVEDVPFPDDRNYNVFALLGNVRNGRGFAGVPTSDGFEYISDSRGLPEGVTEESLRSLSHEHSASWCTLKEIIEYDYSKIVTRCGVISWNAFLSFRIKKSQYVKGWNRDCPQPDSWSGAISGPGITTIEENVAEEYVEKGLPEEFLPEKTYVRVYWQRRYVSIFADFIMDVLPLCKYGLDNVRLVYDFDS